MKTSKKVEEKEYNKVKFYEITEEWLEQKKIIIKESTYANYVYSINKYIYPIFGEFNIQDLKEYNFNNYVSYLMETLSAKTVRDMVSILKSILYYIEDKYSCEFKKKKIQLPKLDGKNIKILSKREKNRLEKYCLKENKLKTIGIIIVLKTGLRIGEVCALKWKNIDLEKRIIYVEHTMQRIYDKRTGKTKVVITKPKTKKSEREIPISDKLYNILKPLKKSYKDDDFFLTGRSDKYIEPRAYENIYKRTLKKSRVKKYKFHALRHTFASNCVEVGMDVKALSEILGHANINITLNLYVHSSYKQKKKYLEKL